MKVRDLRPDDISHLPAGFHAFGPRMETALVVVDDQDRPILACSAERSIELHMACGQGSPGQKLAAIGFMHRAMREKLHVLGFSSASAFVEKERFGKRLGRLFGWTKALPAWSIRF